jgi:putative sigma-54 modulation protein
MQIIIKGRQMQVTPQLRQRIERKVQRLSRLTDDNVRVEVTVTEEQTRSARDRFSVQVALTGNSHPIRSEVSAQNATSALDIVLDKVVTQLGRQKDRHTRIRKHHIPIKVLSLARSGLLSSLEEEEQVEEGAEASFEEGKTFDEAENEQIWSGVMEIRRLPTRPMSDREVIAEMEKSGALYYPFFNEETQSVNVMYRLETGGYGLLVPALA